MGKHFSEKIDSIIEKHKFVNLDIGGALDPTKNFIILDERDHPSVDIKHSFQDYPYPLPTESIDFIKTANVVERISRENKGFIKWMDELWRILKPQRQLAIATYYAGSTMFYQDPCNVNPCNENTWAYFDPLETQSGGVLYKLYRPKPWKIITISFSQNGIMEVLLEKRLLDISYSK